MPQADATVVRKLIEKHEPIEDTELNFLLVDRGIDPQDAIVLQDILLEQDRIGYNHETNCFTLELY
jgi:hypothetical protein